MLTKEGGKKRERGGDREGEKGKESEGAKLKAKLQIWKAIETARIDS